MSRRLGSRRLLLAAAVALAALWALAAFTAVASVAHGRRLPAGLSQIRHVVVIFQENVSFDHYFGTYPHAANPVGDPQFHAAPGTPRAATLTGPLFTANPNGYAPQRLSRSDWPLCDMDHDYDAELRAWNGGRMDQFVREAIDYQRSDDTRTPATYGHVPAGVTGGVTGPDCKTPLPDHAGDQSVNQEVMDYYDGNTVTALWNYAQHGVLFDHFFDAGFGPSAPGAINLISGRTSGVTVPASSDDTQPCSDLMWSVDLGNDCQASPGEFGLFNGDTDVRGGTLIGDADPAYDDCASTNTVALHGPNIGTLLNQHHVTWGWFQGGFKPTTPATGGARAVCGSKHQAVNAAIGLAGPVKKDYSAHHEPFEYYRATANPHHLPPLSVRTVGHSDRANHQYDLSTFFAALKARNLPAVSFLKPPTYQDGHPKYSDPIDEQWYIVNTVNAIERSPDWHTTAIIIAYDDSDGFYDHIAPPILTADGEQVAGPVVDGLQWNGNGCLPSDFPKAMKITATGRCGLGIRLPMLIISPWVKRNYVDHGVGDTTSILRLIEDRFAGGQRLGDGSFDARAGSIDSAFTSRPDDSRLLLDPGSGEPAR